MLPAAFTARLTRLLDRERFLTSAADCMAYAYDNSRKLGVPEAVAFPYTTEEVRAIVAACHDHGVALTPRGRGTGTAGGSVPENGGLVLSLERMHRILAVDPANRIMVVEPGVLNQQVQDAARVHGFFWPPDPSSAAYCTVGGNLATCAAGPHAVKYGVTRDHVLALTAVTGKGEIIHTGTYTTKGVVGYDLTRLIVGSEGTLAVITEAVLKLTPLPEAVAGVTAHFRDLTACARAITRIMAQPHVPSALEFLDAGALNLIRAHYPGLVPADTHAMLMIEVDGSASEIQTAQAAILAACADPELIQAQPVADTVSLWAARKALSPLLRDIAPKKINEDVAVPVSFLPEFLAGVVALAREHRVANVNFGHAGNGNIHVNLLVNPDDEAELARAMTCLDRIFELVIRLRGTLSGEHGVGREKRPYVGREIDPVTLGVMREVKRVFDPKGILNPGKIFPTEEDIAVTAGGKRHA
ncbi:FAD-binding oxidoreductase [Thiobacter aerophilum]|uniref:FAD-linked oxidase C-terminal domain-containing protein n=1 Tax=Thiobacter aerophilum TaxID=3121275 RepID=A0ABV0EFR6_9BURK